MHRAQCSMVSQDALGLRLRPHRGQFRNDALPLTAGSSVLVADPPVIAEGEGRDRLWRLGPVIVRRRVDAAAPPLPGPQLRLRLRPSAQIAAGNPSRSPLLHGEIITPLLPPLVSWSKVHQGDCAHPGGTDAVWRDVATESRLLPPLHPGEVLVPARTTHPRARRGGHVRVRPTSLDYVRTCSLARRGGGGLR
jgi:hypothetical protein